MIKRQRKNITRKISDSLRPENELNQIASRQLALFRTAPQLRHVPTRADLDIVDIQLAQQAAEIGNSQHAKVALAKRKAGSREHA